MTRSHFLVLAVAFVVSLGLGVSVQSGSAASLSLGTQDLTPYRTCIVTATPSTTSSVVDAEVAQLTPTVALGTGITTELSSTSSANERIYVRFDLSGCSPAIPAGATIKTAALRLYVTSLPNSCRTIDIFRVTSSWSESAVTWNNQPFGTTINNPSNTTRSDSFNAGSTGSCQNGSTGYVTGADVPADVAAFIAGTANNYGWMLRDDSEDAASGRTTTFAAKELGTLAQAPQLVITYVTAP
jgi:hypothetical protein